MRPCRKFLPRYIGLRSFVGRRSIRPPAVIVRWRPPGWTHLSNSVLGYTSALVEVDGEAINSSWPLKRLSSARHLGGLKRNSDVIVLERGGAVRVRLESIATTAVLFDRTFPLDDDGILLIIAIDRFLRLPGNPSTIVEHSTLRL